MGTSWSNSRNTTLEYVARSIHTDPPPPPLRTDLGFKKPSSLATGRFTPVPADWLRGRRWEPCVFDEPTADGVAGAVRKQLLREPKTLDSGSPVSMP